MQKLDIHSLKNETTMDARTTIKKDIDLREIKVNIPEKEKLNDKYFSESDQKYYDIILENEPVNNNVLNFKNNYKLGKIIGEGAYGKVYECLDTSLGQVMAVKVFDISKLSSKLVEEKLDSFIAESKVLSKLNNKNTVKFFGVHKDNQTFKIFLELVIGGSLSKIISTYGRLPEKLVKKYTLEILYGLEYLHMHNVIHRDIKGANILVDRDGTCKLSDFGSAKEIIEEFEFSEQNSLKGTPNWMAPECVKSMEYSRFSDIWSLGCTIIEMLTGKPPFHQFKTQMAALYNIMNVRESPTLPENIKVSDECKDFISKCLAIEPRERWNVRKLLHHKFITLISDNNNTLNHKNISKNENREVMEVKEKNIVYNVKNNEEYYDENNNYIDQNNHNKIEENEIDNKELSEHQDEEINKIDKLEHENNYNNGLEENHNVSSNRDSINEIKEEDFKNDHFYIEEESKSDKYKNIEIINDYDNNVQIKIEEPEKEEVNGNVKTIVSNKINPINRTKQKIVMKTKSVEPEKKNIVIKRKKKD